MKKTIAISGLAASVLLLTACASNPTSLAIQKENNQFEVTGLGKNQLTAKNNAINAASKTCGSRATEIIIDEKTGYKGALKGVVDDHPGQMIQAAATVLGNIAGTNTGLNQNDDYQTILTFRCQAK